MVQPLPIICTVRPTTVSTATIPAKARAKQGVMPSRLLWNEVWHQSSTPYQILCNGIEQKSSEARAGLSLAASRCTPFHKIRYGIVAVGQLLDFRRESGEGIVSQVKHFEMNQL